MKKIDLYTDGACTGNPGKGGYGAVLIYYGVRKEISGGYILTTNNRMELIAAIEALKKLKEPCEVNLYSDSKYLTDAINKGWLNSWKKNNWKKSDRKQVLNVDLWEELLTLMSIHSVNYIWVKGHAGNEFNEICDTLAVEAYTNSATLEDIGYKKE